GLHGALLVPFLHELTADDRAYRPIFEKCVALDVPAWIQASVNWSPGHTMDSACYFEEHSGVFFAGDTVFPKGGLPRIFDGSKELLKRSYDRIEKEVVGKGKILAPGHGEPGGFVEEFEAAQNALGFI
ncbi:MAG: hypothetical protein ACE5DI_03775, partial [Candidatus Micrarchaeia archaeon]